MHARTREGESAIATETDDVEARSIRLVEDRAGIADEDTLRTKLGEVFPETATILDAVNLYFVLAEIADVVNVTVF